MQELLVFNGLFLIAILGKDSILDVWQSSEYANEYGCKIFAKWSLVSTKKHQNIMVHWYEKSYALSTYSLFMPNFIQFALLDFSSPKTSFSSLYFIFDFIDTPIVKNKCFLLASKLSRFYFVGTSLTVSSNSHHQRHI